MAEPTVASKERIPYWIKVVTVFFFGWIFMYATRTILNRSWEIYRPSFL